MFAGRVMMELESPGEGVPGVKVRGTAVKQSALTDCAAEPVVTRGSTTAEPAGEYELMLPLSLGTDVCVRLEAWKDGARVGKAEVVGYVYDTGDRDSPVWT